MIDIWIVFQWKKIIIIGEGSLIGILVQMYTLSTSLQLYYALFVVRSEWIRNWLLSRLFTQASSAHQRNQWTRAQKQNKDWKKIVICRDLFLKFLLHRRKTKQHGESDPKVGLLMKARHDWRNYLLKVWKRELHKFEQLHFSWNSSFKILIYLNVLFSDLLYQVDEYFRPWANRRVEI